MWRPLSILVAVALLVGAAGPVEAQRAQRTRVTSRVRPPRVRRPAPRPRVAMPPRRSWKQRGQVRDVTGRFADEYRRAAAGTSVLPAGAHEYVYLIIPGAMGNTVPGYMARTQRHLRSLGLDVHRSRINTAAGVAENAATIRDEVMALSKGRRSVVLVTHSKGGVDALAADAIYREIRPHLRARVLMQPPFDGTPMADMLDNAVSRLALRLLGGQAAMMGDLKGEARRSFNAANRHSSVVPTVTLATSHTGWSMLTPMAAMIRFGGDGDSDGVVPERSQEVPGTHVVRLERLDHWGAVLRVPGSAYRPGPLAEALISIALTIR